MRIPYPRLRCPFCHRWMVYDYPIVLHLCEHVPLKGLVDLDDLDHVRCWACGVQVLSGVQWASSLTDHLNQSQECVAKMLMAGLA